MVRRRVEDSRCFLRQSSDNQVERYEFEYYGAIAQDRMRAYQTMRRAADLAPDRLPDLAGAALSVGRYRETVEILERPDLPLGFGVYPWSWLCIALHFLGEHERELEAARQSRRENPGHRFFMVFEINALAALGRMDELEATLNESLATGRTTEGTAPMGWLEAGLELLWHGYEEEGRAVLERVIAHVLGEPPETHDQDLIAGSLLAVGRFEEARALYEQFVAEEPENDEALAFLAMAAAGLGDRETALRVSAQLGAVERTQLLHARNILRRAQIAGALGDCAGAVEFLEDALMSNLGHFLIHGRYGLMQCRDYPAFQEVAKARE